jgi:hypothetical protein
MVAGAGFEPDDQRRIPYTREYRHVSRRPIVGLDHLRIYAGHASRTDCSSWSCRAFTQGA